MHPGGLIEVEKHPWRLAGCPKKPKREDTYSAGDRGWLRDLAREDPHTLREAVGESKQGQVHAQAHEKPLLGMGQGLQDTNKEFEGKPKEGIKKEKEEKRAWSTSDIGLSLFGPVWHLIEKPQLKFQEVWIIFGILANFCAKNRVFLPVRRATSTALRIASSKSQMVCIFGFNMKNHNHWCLDKEFGHDLSLQEVKNTEKMTSLPLFWHTGSSLRRMKIWRGKWAPNSEIPLGLASRQARLSKKHTWSHFGLLQVPQNSLQIGAAHIELGATHIEKKAKFTSVSRNFHSQLSPSGPAHLHFTFLIN